MSIIENNSKIVFWGLVWILLLSLCSIAADAQTDSTFSAQAPDANRKYFGYTLFFGSQRYDLSSDIAPLNELSVNREGGSVGIIYGNRKGFLKSTVGLYFSSSGPSSIDVVETGISGCLYLLRLKSSASHTIEPYVSISTKGLRSIFYGNYGEKETPKNYSLSDENRIGTLYTGQAFVGLGAEFQLENETSDFIHIFTEIRFGSSFINQSSENLLKGTNIGNAMSFSIGINFGKIK
jgi:hypothetical protein